MISFFVVMGHELTNRSTQRRLSNEDHPIQTFVFDCAHESLRVGVQVRRHRRQPDNLRSTLLHKPPELRGVLRVSINNQVTLGSERTALLVAKISAHLQHPRFTWPCGDACNLHKRSARLITNSK